MGSAIYRTLYMDAGLRGRGPLPPPDGMGAQGPRPPHRCYGSGFSWILGSFNGFAIYVVSIGYEYTP